jgi:hypothetical protein
MFARVRVMSNVKHMKPCVTRNPEIMRINTKSPNFL